MNVKEDVRKEVREGYAKIAKKGLPSGLSSSCCCNSEAAEEQGMKIGYTAEDLHSVPDGANLNLGCGNPVALASLNEGETVVDLGSGAGLDCFLAAKKVGAKGKVIGIDMTPEMIDKARKNARKSNYKNVEFRLGEIENLPVADNTADLVMSNCVINLSPSKTRVFEEAYRALKPGGRLMVSDIVLLKEIPEAIRAGAHPASCVRGAIAKEEYLKSLREVGFRNVEILEEKQESFEDVASDPNAKVLVANPEKKSEELKVVSELEGKTRDIVRQILESTASITVSATKPPKVVS
ncbi:MAG: arsenite methyltransferase [Candidatus Bathyarchaeota archaeon]|nr:MAG: arsenite methyltransferase [Candidatus Bathyarchaeota archaeon]